MHKAKVSDHIIDPKLENPDGFSAKNATVAFYHQVSKLATRESCVLDLGAGRAAWSEDPNLPPDHPRILQGAVDRVIAVDVDPIVLENPTADECLVMTDGRIPLEASSVDIIVSDFVLEHVESPESFREEVSRVLRPGGWFCARTPHTYNYVSLVAKLVKNNDHASVLKFAQPKRKSIDVFPTFYRLNSIGVIERTFENFRDYSFIYRSEPAYTFGSKIIYNAMSVVHKFAPEPFYGTIYAFLRKM